jgi:tungstate transport system ATP-binding protein
VNSPWLYRLDRVTQSYGGHRVLDIERLEVVPGELLCLLGPTGAGKSTLLRLLSGIEPPAAGDLRFGDFRFDGRDLPDEVRHRITLVFQRPQLLGGTAQANVEYGIRLRGGSQYRRRAQEMLGHLGLDKLGSRSVQTLSGGETQLVALARALVLEPEVLLLDEPTANLDPARVALVEKVIRAVHREHRTTIVWATHNLFQARRVSERVALLLHGTVVELAPVKEFFEAPCDPRTAAFVRGEVVYAWDIDRREKQAAAPSPPPSG